MQELICSICNKNVKKSDPKFHFPHMPKWHKFFDLSGGTFHLDCMKTLDNKRTIGEELATASEKIASKTDFEPLILRNGNIIVQARLDEKAVEIIDYEDFVEFAIPIMNLDLVANLMPLESVKNRMTSIGLLQDDQLELMTSFYSVKLEKLSFTRLKQIIKEINTDIFDDSYLNELIIKEMKKRQNNII